MWAQRTSFKASQVFNRFFLTGASMIDMAQAEVGLRKASGPIPYGWREVKVNHEFKRGDFCVIRQCSGSPEVLKVETQWAWKEWTGAFSYLG